jgi:hypothetical protein
LAGLGRVVNHKAVASSPLQGISKQWKTSLI